jgi:hypothetical protein
MRTTVSASAKPDPPVAVETPSPDIAAEYEAASAAWHEVNTTMRDLRARLERLRLAKSFAGVDVPERSRELAATVAGLTIACVRSPLRAASDIESLEFDVVALQPEHTAAHDRYLSARSAAAAQIAMSFRGRHLEATQNIVVAVEMLSSAIAAERDVRQEFARASPEATSVLLPPISDDLREMDLSRWDSTASVWARRIRNFGVEK